jgi:hypothetical protein
MPTPPAPTPAADLAEITEVKRTLSGREKRFSCRLIAGDDRAAVVLFVAPEAMHVHGVDLPAGTVTFGHFWTDRPYNVYHWMDPAGVTIGFYFNLSDGTAIAPARLEWRDLTVDVLVRPDGRVDVLDEDELPADLDGALRAHIDAARAAVLADPRGLAAAVEARSRALFARVLGRAFGGGA